MNIRTLLFGLCIVGCSAQQTVSTTIRLSKEECQSKALTVISQDKSCPEIQVELDALAWKAPECITLLQGKTFGEFCAQPDGGFHE